MGDSMDKTLRLISPPPSYSPIPPYSSIAPISSDSLRLLHPPKTKPLDVLKSTDLLLPYELRPVTLEQNSHKMQPSASGAGKTRSREKIDGMHDILDVLHKITEVIVGNIRSKSQGLKFEARVARDKILAEATIDLEMVRTSGAECYNRLLELKCANDNNGTQLRKSWEELKGSNDKLNSRLQDHSRKTGAKVIKGISAQLSTHSLPDSFRSDV